MAKGVNGRACGSVHPVVQAGVGNTWQGVWESDWSHIYHKPRAISPPSARLNRMMLTPINIIKNSKKSCQPKVRPRKQKLAYWLSRLPPSEEQDIESTASAGKSRQRDSYANKAKYEYRNRRRIAHGCLVLPSRRIGSTRSLYPENGAGRSCQLCR